MNHFLAQLQSTHWPVGLKDPFGPVGPFSYAVPGAPLQQGCGASDTSRESTTVVQQ